MGSKMTFRTRLTAPCVSIIFCASLTAIAEPDADTVNFIKSSCLGTSSGDGYYKTTGLEFDDQHRLIITDFMDPKVKSVDPFSRTFLIDLNNLQAVIPQNDGVGLRLVCKPKSCFQKGTYGPDFYNNNALIYCGKNRDQVESHLKGMSGLASSETE